MRASRPYNAQGDFVLNNVVPGSYTLTAMQSDSGKILSARMPLEVGTSSIEGLALTLAPAAELSGHLKIEGTAGEIKNFRVSLVPRSGFVGGGGFGPGAQGGTLKAENAFTIANVQPEQYDFRISGVPDGGYVKAIRVGDADVTESGVDFTGGVISAEVTVLVSMTAAQIDGTVQNDKSEPAPGAFVVAIPEGKRREIDRYYATAATDDSGHFTLKNLAPGDYRVYAFDLVENGAYMDPDWVKPFESKGGKVAVKDSGRESIQLKLALTQAP